jgi:hypothetical protein
MKPGQVLLALVALCFVSCAYLNSVVDRSVGGSSPVAVETSSKPSLKKQSVKEKKQEAEAEAHSLLDGQPELGDQELVARMEGLIGWVEDPELSKRLDDAYWDLQAKLGNVGGMDGLEEQDTYSRAKTTVPTSGMPREQNTAAQAPYWPTDGSLMRVITFDLQYTRNTLSDETHHFYDFVFAANADQAYSYAQFDVLFYGSGEYLGKGVADQALRQGEQTLSGMASLSGEPDGVFVDVVQVTP